VAVQQGQLEATDTTKDMENFYNDSVVSTSTDVDRIIHNGTQFVRLVLKRPQPRTAQQGSSASPNSLSDADHYIDGFFTANPSSDINLIVIGFGTPVSTSQIKVYSTQFIDDTAVNWTVSTSVDGTDSQFSNTSFEAPVTSVNTVFDGSISQFVTTIDVNLPAVDPNGEGLPFWRLVHSTTGEFNDVTEVDIVEPLTPTISYFDTDGLFATSTTFEKTNILDAAYDNINNVFYTIRFNTDNVGSTSISLDDDFSDADAGTASGTNDFNPARWQESTANPQFIRSNDQLVYNVAAGNGQLETTYTLSGDLDINLDVNPQTINDNDSWLAIRALDTNNNTIMSEGVGLTNAGQPTVTGVWFATFVDELVNSTNDCELREARGVFHNTTVGTDSFTVTFNGSTWAVSGTLTGALADATTGVVYDEGTDAQTPIEFIISCTATPTTGEQFTFDLITSTTDKPPTESGIIGFSRTGSTYNNKQVPGPTTISTSDVSIEIFGHATNTIDIEADNYDVVTGSGVFPDLAVFTVEKTDDDGLVSGPALIESFDVIGDPSKGYNDFLDGKVQIAATSSGTGGGFIYLKVNDSLYKYDNSVSLGTEDGSSATQESTGQISSAGTNSLNWTHESGIGGLPFLTYIEFDDTLNIVRLKTIDKDTLLNTTDQKEIFLDISSYEANKFKVFYDQNDFDTLYYVDSATNLQSFNVDDRISAFMAVNADDTTLPAGTAQQTIVNADVINAWGETLNGKVVTFAVTAGDGAVSPSTDTTVSGGRAFTQFTVGSTVGVSTVTATVTEA